MALSPSGERIAARARVDGKVVLIVFDRETKKVIGGLQPESDDAINSFNWVNDDRLVFTYAEQRFGSDQRSSMGELYAVDFDGANSTMLAGFRASNARAGSRLGGTRKGDKAAVSLIDVLEEDADHVLIAKFPFSADGFRYAFDGKRPPIVSKLNVYSGKQTTVGVSRLEGRDPLQISRVMCVSSLTRLKMVRQNQLTVLKRRMIGNC